MLDSIAKLGFHFKAIMAFIDGETDGGDSSSMYCRALASGLQGGRI
jgi:hypothetical protein